MSLVEDCLSYSGCSMYLVTWYVSIWGSQPYCKHSWLCRPSMTFDLKPKHILFKTSRHPCKRVNTAFKLTLLSVKEQYVIVKFFKSDFFEDVHYSLTGFVKTNFWRMVWMLTVNKYYKLKGVEETAAIFICWNPLKRVFFGNLSWKIDFKRFNLSEWLMVHDYEKCLSCCTDEWVRVIVKIYRIR